jgi:hypothetical protein
MRTSRRSRTLATRIAALSAGLGVAALVGLGATAAQALPPTSSTPTTTATATTAATTTGATTTAATTTAATTTDQGGTTTAP